MRIGIWWYQESWGGVDTHLLALLSHWPGEDQFVIIHNEDNEGLKRIRNDLAAIPRVSFHSGKTSKRYFGLFGRIASYFFLPLTFAFQILRGIWILKRVGRIDALMCVNGNYPGAWSGLAALRSAKFLKISKRMLLIHHESEPRRVFLNTFEHLIDLSVQKSATDLVCVSLATRKTIIDRRGFNTVMNPIRVIHNGISFGEVAYDKKVDLRKTFNIPKTEFLIGILGRIERYKGHEDLILGLSELPDSEKRKIRLMFIGSGQEIELDRLTNLAIASGIQDRITFCGYIPGNPMSIVAQLDLLAMLTKDFEGFGYTIAEAMSVGTPVLATRVGAVEEFVSDEFAKLVPPESPSSIADALSEFLKNRKSFLHRAKKSKNHIRSFSAEMMAKRFHRLLTT